MNCILICNSPRVSQELFVFVKETAFPPTVTISKILKFSHITISNMKRNTSNFHNYSSQLQTIGKQKTTMYISYTNNLSVQESV